MPLDIVLPELVRLIYDAAADASRWPEFLECFLCAVSGSAIALVHPPLVAHKSGIAGSFGLDPAWHSEQEQHRAAKNVWWIAPDSFHCFGGTIRHASYLTAMRPLNASPFGDREFGLMESLIPHLDSALKVHDRLAGLEMPIDHAFHLLDRNAHGVLLFGPDGNLRFMNRAARTILNAGDGLAWSRDGLVVADPRAAKAVRSLIAASGRGPGRVASVPRPSMRRPYEVMVEPLPPGIQQHGSFVVLLSDPDQHTLPDASAVRQLFGLTGAEARLAVAVANGRSIEEAALEFGISVHTARTQAKSLLSKTGCRRQSELVRLLMNSLARRVP